MRHAPSYIQFYPTMRCNLSCDFCFNQSMPFCSDMPFGDIKKTVDALVRLKVRTIDVIGGEPTLHKDIILMLEYAQTKRVSVNLSSNGTQPEILAAIMERFRKVNVGVSINDWSMLREAKGFIKKYRPAAKMVFLNDLDGDLLENILLLGPKRFYLLYPDIVKSGRIENSVSFPQFLISAQKIFRSHLVDTVYCSGFIPDVRNYPALARARCPAGTTKLGIMPDGSVYPCNLFFGKTEFRLGNILRDKFENIWNHKKLNFFRNFNGNKCPQASCILKESCRGGCPAHGLIHYGALDSPEPRCNINR